MSAARFKPGDVRDDDQEEIKASTINSAQAAELDGIADVLHYLHNIQPLEGCDYNDDDEFKCGRAGILEWLERRVRAVGSGVSNDSG